MLAQCHSGTEFRRVKNPNRRFLWNGEDRRVKKTITFRNLCVHFHAEIVQSESKDSVDDSYSIISDSIRSHDYTSARKNKAVKAMSASLGP